MLFFMKQNHFHLMKQTVLFQWNVVLAILILLIWVGQKPFKKNTGSSRWSIEIGFAFQVAVLFFKLDKILRIDKQICIKKYLNRSSCLQLINKIISAILVFEMSLVIAWIWSNKCGKYILIALQLGRI